MNFKTLNCISLNKSKYFLGNEIAVISMPVVLSKLMYARKHGSLNELTTNL